MIEAVLFDMGGTLETFSYSEEMRRQATPRLNDLLVSFGINLGLAPDDLYQLVAAGLKQYKSLSVRTEEELPTARIWTEYLLPAFPQYFDLLEKHSEKLTYWIDVNFYERKLRPEVPGVLADLKQRGFKLGLISNIASRSQVPENLRNYGILEYFSVIILSSEYGLRKPDPAIFHHAASRIGTPASRCAYIGDRVARDINGSRRAGYAMAIQIAHDFDHGESDDGPAADAVIHNLGELAPLIHLFNCEAAHQQQPGRIKALFFDAGDILYYRPRRGQPLAEFLAVNGITNPEQYQPAITAIKEKAYNGELSRSDYFREYIKAYGITDPHEIQRGSEILSNADDDIIFFDGVADSLRKLKRQGYLLGIITDTAVPTSNKLRWFETGGFGDVWDAYISSRDVGFQKPDLRIFQAAMRQVNLPAGQTCFIGHSTDELDGARAAGMHTISFNADQDASAEYAADHFSDLIGLLDTLQKGNE